MAFRLNEKQDKGRDKGRGKELRAVLRFCLACAMAVAAFKLYGEGFFRIDRVAGTQRLVLSDGTIWNLRRLYMTAAPRHLSGAEIEIGPSVQNRYGEEIGNLYFTDGTGIQAGLVAAGQALVDPVASGLSSFNEDYRTLLALEQQAMADRRGLWAREMRLLDPAALEQSPLQYRGKFVIVQGRITASDSRRVENAPVIFINFGDAYQTDFTVIIEPPQIRRFQSRLRSLGLKQSALAGQLVRVRGRVTLYNGPLIRLTHPLALQIEGHDF